MNSYWEVLLCDDYLSIKKKYIKKLVQSSVLLMLHDSIYRIYYWSSIQKIISILIKTTVVCFSPKCSWNLGLCFSSHSVDWFSNDRRAWVCAGAILRPAHQLHAPGISRWSQVLICMSSISCSKERRLHNLTPPTLLNIHFLKKSRFLKTCQIQSRVPCWLVASEGICNRTGLQYEAEGSPVHLHSAIQWHQIECPWLSKKRIAISETGQLLLFSFTSDQSKAAHSPIRDTRTGNNVKFFENINCEKSTLSSWIFAASLIIVSLFDALSEWIISRDAHLWRNWLIESWPNSIHAHTHFFFFCFSGGWE